MSACLAIVVSGPDGSGKSTLSDAISRQLDAAAVPWQRVYVRPRRLDRLLRQESPPDHAPVDPHRHARQLAPVVACAKAGWMALDAATLWLDRGRAKRTGGVLLIERGIEDVAIDPTRYGLSRAPVWFLRRLVQLSSVADRIVLCLCSPEVAYARKGETNVAAIDAQYQTWTKVRRMRRFWGKVWVIDTEQPVDPDEVDRLLASGNRRGT